MGSVELCLSDTPEMADNNAEAPSATDIVSFCLEDSDTSDVDSKFVSLTTAQVGADDISLDSHVSNGHESSCDSLGDNEDIFPR